MFTPEPCRLKLDHRELLRHNRLESYVTRRPYGRGGGGGGDCLHVGPILKRND